MSTESDSRYDNFEDDLRIVSNEVEGRIKSFLQNRSYGSEIEDISIIPIIIRFDDKMESEGWFKEKKTIKTKKKQADIRLRVDYDKFVKGDNEKKKLLIINNVIESVREIGKRAKKDFKAQELENDILNIFNLAPTDLKNI